MLNRINDGRIHVSASDLAGHLGCRHLTTLDLAVAKGKIDAPAWRDPALALLQERGLKHETAYVQSLRDAGLSVVEIAAADTLGSAFERTRAAMVEGAAVIVQAPLVSGRWFGRADVLRRVEQPSALGNWSYEVVDTKLSQETRAGTVLQLCLYSDIVRDIQEALPEYMHAVPPGFQAQSFRALDFLAYYRFVRRRLESAMETQTEPSTYPDPTAHCDVCRWFQLCDRRRRGDDHLCLVAGISKLQTRELQSCGVTTLRELSSLPLPLTIAPRRGAQEGYVRVREQARLQLETRSRGQPVYELLPTEESRGLARLPEPSPGDVFLDLEGDPFVANGGREYLFGHAVSGGENGPHYVGQWSLSAGDERVAFEAFVDTVMERWQRHPELHVYHFAPYEPAALRRLMNRYATRADEIDRMLRAGLFVDLHSIVKQALRAGVETYSIKDLEVFYGYERRQSLDTLPIHRLAIERVLELDQPDCLSPDTFAAVETYNRDDCLSAMFLRNWLEGTRRDLESRGEKIGRPEVKRGDPSEQLGQRQLRNQELRERLIRDVPLEPSERSEEEHGRWLLGHMLDWHRREENVGWWEYYRLRDLSDEELLEERTAISGLRFEDRVGGTKRCPIDRYRFPPQEVEVRPESDLHSSDGTVIGVVEAIDSEARCLDVKKRGTAADLHPTSVFAHKVVRADVLTDSLLRLGEWVAQHSAQAEGPYGAARDLLLRRPPCCLCAPTERPLQHEGEEVVASARRLARELDRGVLPVQGPPGSGKTHTGARMICELVRTGKKVGVTAVSHKVIRNLLEEVVRAARAENLPISCVEKVNDKADEEPCQIKEVTANERVLAALSTGDAQVGAGTAWLWARDECFEAVDVLFVDEAGQMSLANVLAVSQAAKSLVLLGDPQQLEQPQQGNHPDGTGVSALEHLLGDHKTMPADRGLFLAETWRLHPVLCAFTSELFYDDRLQSRPGLEQQRLQGPTPFAGSGLLFVPVDHEGNQNRSLEEVEKVVQIVTMLTAPVSSWIDKCGEEHPLGSADIMVVAPYNLQVAELGYRLPRGTRVGTVDRFQGQEAPVIIYSMATSSPEDAPRGMEFLYSLNRLNVATSRARCSCILVATPRLFEPECRTPRQMQLANAYCRYLEMARTVRL